MSDPFIHLDFDETIVSSLICANDTHALQILDMYGHLYNGAMYKLVNSDGWDMQVDWMVTFIRPSTPELLSLLFNKYGAENVGILSRGMDDYVLKASTEVELPILKSNIYGFSSLMSTVPRFKDRNNILIDDRTYDQQEAERISKLDFLFGLPSEKYINVPEFDVRTFREEFDINPADIMTNIERRLKLGH